MQLGKPVGPSRNCQVLHAFLGQLQETGIRRASLVELARRMQVAGAISQGYRSGQAMRQALLQLMQPELHVRESGQIRQQPQIGSNIAKILKCNEQRPP